ncbi:MAG: aminomethyltransferase family protein [Dehalococcoidia bacterium]
MNRSSLYEAQKRLNPQWTEFHHWDLPMVFSSADREYEAAKKSVALMDRSYVGRIKVQGQDSLDLLNRLTTNSLMELKPGMGTSTVLTSNKGRVLEHLIVYARDDSLLLLVSPQNRQKAMEWIDRYIFTEDVTLSDITEETGMLSLFGPRSAEALKGLSGQDIQGLLMHHCTKLSVEGIQTLACRAENIAGLGFNLIMDAPQLEKAWEFFLSKGEGYGIKPMGREAYEILRIEGGIPEYGKELSEDINPLEARLDSSISFTKGCYVGQEVVARLNTYKKVQKYLVGIQFDADSSPQAGEKLRIEGDEVGYLTSVACPPNGSKVIALGYVRAKHAEPGVKVYASDGQKERSGEIVELPFAI